jgi:DNA-binding NarL/FixJ family response regulator
MIEDQMKRDVLVRQLGLDAEGEDTLDRAIAAQRRINRKQAEFDSLLATRRAAVLGLHGHYGVTKYRIAKVLGISQTTVGNITKGKEGVEE